MIYLDTCALIKLVWAEEHSADLVSWLAQHENRPLVSSVLTETEMRRAVWRIDHDAWEDAAAVLDELTLLPVDSGVLRVAGKLSQPYLRTLDAIHLATILRGIQPGHVDYFVTYDKRLAQAAEELGFPVASPGSAP